MLRRLTGRSEHNGGLFLDSLRLLEARGGPGPSMVLRQVAVVDQRGQHVTDHAAALTSEVMSAES